jgi:hypothetical protein
MAPLVLVQNAIGHTVTAGRPCRFHAVSGGRAQFIGLAY